MDERPLAALIHGLGRTRASMALLGRRLRGHGFETVLISYPSILLTLDEACDHVRGKLEEEMASRPGRRVHLVGHSLGGVIAAHLMEAPRGLSIGRVVQIGSPNLGSPLAQRIEDMLPPHKGIGEVLTDLTPKSRRRRPPSPRIYAIAGSASLPWAGLAKPNDGVVSVRSAWAAAHWRRSVRAPHTLLPASARAAKLVAEALTTPEPLGEPA